MTVDRYRNRRPCSRVQGGKNGFRNLNGGRVARGNDFSLELKHVVLAGGVRAA